MFPEVQLGGSIQIDAPMLGPKQRTLSPAVTGGAILAVKVSYHGYAFFQYLIKHPPPLGCISYASCSRPLYIKFLFSMIKA